MRHGLSGLVVRGWSLHIGGGARKLAWGWLYAQIGKVRRLVGWTWLLALALTLSSRVARADDAWLGRDKLLHFSVSAVLAGGGYALGTTAFHSRKACLVLGGSLALGAGVAKEIADRYTGGDPSWRDLTWDVVGTATGLLTAFLLDKHLFRPDTPVTGARSF